MQRKDVMTPRVDVMAPEASISEAAEQMRHRDIGPLPVWESERVVGMLTDRDITVRAVAAGRAPRMTQVRDVRAPDVVYGREDQEGHDAVRLLEQSQMRRLPVLNRSQQRVGMVALSDLAVHAETPPVAAAVLKQVSEPGTARRNIATPARA
jgi:CBS domain-containing protein